GNGRHLVPAVGLEPEAAAWPDPAAQAGRAHRVACVQHGRLAPRQGGYLHRPVRDHAHAVPVDGRREGPAIAAEYRGRLAACRAEADRLEPRHARLAWTRLGLFFSGVLILVVLGRAGFPWLALPIAAFVPLLFVHARVLNARDRALRAAAFYERGLARISNTWHGTGERGERYRDPSHLYAEDLDLFGAGGLFELLVTTRTRAGEDMLAR